MEEERVVMTVGRTGKVMLDYIFKTLSYIATSTMQGIEWWHVSRQFSGETHWNKLMASGDELGVQALAHTEVNLDKLKVELEKYGIGFAFYKSPNSEVTHMAYAIRHENIVKQTFQDILKDMTKAPEEFINKVKKDSHEKSFDEKLNYYKKETDKQVTEKTATQQMKMESKTAIDDFFNKTANKGGKSL